MFQPAIPQHSFISACENRDNRASKASYVYVFYMSMSVLLASGPTSSAVATAGCRSTLQPGGQKYCNGCLKSAVVEVTLQK